MFILNRYRKFHFVGIGGAGMSTLAELLFSDGFQISGSDIKASAPTRALAEKGVSIHIGHDETGVEQADIVVMTAAVHEDNPEIKIARKMNIPVIKRAELLGQLMRFFYGIGIAGTHGKTTVTAMVGWMLHRERMNSIVAVGGEFVDHIPLLPEGETRFFVAEADEYDRSFLRMHPCLSVVTSIEPEHLECYGSYEILENQFVEFANRTPFFGRQIVCIDSPGIKKLIPRLQGPLTTYGLSDKADIQGIIKGDRKFEVRQQGRRLGDARILLPGTHNLLNSLATISIGLELGVEFYAITNALNQFRGVKRRLELRSRLDMNLGRKKVRDLLLVDDYAHHPTEVKAGLTALSSTYRRRIVLIFQPHLYSRTQQFSKEFAKSFLAADIAIISKIFPAREKPIPGISGEMLAELSQEMGHQNVYFAEDFDQIMTLLEEVALKNDIIVTMGAGDINQIIDRLEGKR